MADVAPEVKETVVEKKVEKPEVTETETPAEESPAKKEKNGDAAVEEKEKTENGVEDKCALKNGSVKQNGFSEKEAESTESPESTEVCGIKRKSVGLEEDKPEVESSEKKPKLEVSAEPEVAANGDVEAKA